MKNASLNKWSHAIHKTWFWNYFSNGFHDEGSGVQRSFRVFAMTRQFQSKWRNKVNKEKETSVRDCLRTFGAQISCNEHSQWQNFWVFRLSFPWDSAVLLQLHKRGLTWHWNQKEWKFACEHMWDILRWFDLRNLIQKLQRQPTFASDYISRPTKKTCTGGLRGQKKRTQFTTCLLVSRQMHHAECKCPMWQPRNFFPKVLYSPR